MMDRKDMALGAGRRMRGMMAAGKAKNFKGSMRRLMGYLSPYAGLVGIAFAMMVVATALTAVAPRILAQTTNEIARGVMEHTGIDMTLLMRILVALMAVYLLSALCNYGVQFVLSGVTQRVMYDLRSAVDRKLDRLPLRYLDGHSFGDTLSRVTNDVDTIATSLQQSLSQSVSSVLSVLMILVMMLTINPALTLAGVITMPLGALLTAKIIRFSQRFFREQQKALGSLNGYIEEMMNGHTVQKAYGREAAVSEEFSHRNAQLYHSAWKAQFCSGLMMPLVGFLTNVGYVLVTVLGGWLVISGRLMVGDIQAMVQYLRQMSHPVSMFANIANVLQSAVAAAERIFELLDEQEENPDPVCPATLAHVRGNVSLEEVYFSYGAEPVIRGVSAQVHSGQMVAIVGPTGSGKTTLVNLLLRFYEVESGHIYIDGVSTADMTRTSLRAHFGMVLQDTWLFKGSIMENIRYGRLNATDSEVEQAAKAAHAHHFIQQVPGGYQFELGENAENISQGQRQLLTIARAILSNPDILILDEATSSVDTRTELLLQRAMRSLMKGRTSFVIAHRLSTIRDADMLLVLQKGRIVERGTHQQLLAAHGFYAELYQSQFSDGN
ncbi:MAG: ABC transporter ATP-binding protein [Oscillospiraceae bacterium]